MSLSGQEFLSMVINVVLGMQGLALVLTFIRLVRGPTLPDRVVSLDLIATMTVGIIAVYTIATGQAVFARVAIVLALISFLGTVAFAYYVEKRGVP